MFASYGFNEQEEVEFPVYHLVERGIKHNLAAPYFTFYSLATLFNCMKKIANMLGS